MSREKLLINDSKSNNSEDMSNKQIEEMIEFLNNRINVERNSYFGKGCITIPLIESDKILDILKDHRKQNEGEWIARDCITESKRGRTIHYSTHKCSVCGKWNGRHKPNYCPNCGAKMKGGKVNEKSEETPKKHFTPEDVRKMTRAEVRENYTAIINSMKEWN